jgi:hypothetical protein
MRESMVKATVQINSTHFFFSIVPHVDCNPKKYVFWMNIETRRPWDEWKNTERVFPMYT